LLGIADRMAGEEVACPRCGQRVLTPAHRRPPEPAILSNGPPPLPRKSIFPELPVVLDPPEPGLRIGLPASEPRSRPEPVRKPWQARLVAVFLIFGGIWAFVHVIGFIVISKAVCCFWPGMLAELVWALAAIVRGGQLLIARGRPRVPAIVVMLQVFTCGAFDLGNTLLGVLNVLLVCSPAARRYYRNEWGETDAV
jgi:hypothetical protein